MDTEELRKSYKPDKVKILFVGESPPHKRTFFYQTDSNLYRETLKAFKYVFPRITDANFLDEFKNMGCYLVDLWFEPIDHLPDWDRMTYRELGIPLMAEYFKILNPNAIVVVMKSIKESVEVARIKSGIKIELNMLPFPGRPNHKVTYVKDLTTYIKDFQKLGFLPPSS